MNSASTSLPCLLLMLGRGRGPRGSAPSALGAQGRSPVPGFQTCRSTCNANDTLVHQSWKRTGKNSEQKERERAVCRLPRGVDAQPLRDLHIPKTQRCSYSPDASAHITAGKESKPCCVQELNNVDAITPP